MAKIVRPTRLNDLERMLALEKESSEKLRRQVDGKEKIAEGTKLALHVKTELIGAKDEIIKGLNEKSAIRKSRGKLDLSKECAAENINVTSKLTNDVLWQEKIKKVTYHYDQKVMLLNE